ncbi:hypothetical protein ACVJGD_000976 [Bradyrhizobium sp. USDA 10063]
MLWMSWTKFTRLWSLKSVLGGLAVLGIATTGYVVHGGGGPTNSTGGGGQGAPGGIHGAPGPVAGAGLPLALIAVGYGVYRLVRRRHKSH